MYATNVCMHKQIDLVTELPEPLHNNIHFLLVLDRHLQIIRVAESASGICLRSFSKLFTETETAWLVRATPLTISRHVWLPL